MPHFKSLFTSPLFAISLTYLFLFGLTGDFYSSSISEDEYVSIDNQDTEPLRNEQYVDQLNNESADLISTGKLALAIDKINEALSISEIINDDEGRAFAFGNLGNYYISMGMADSVITALMKPYKDLQHTAKAVSIGNLIATAHRDKSNYQEALKIYLEVLDKAEKDGNLRMQAAVKQNIASVYEALGDYPQAIDNYMQGLDLAEQLDDSLTIAVILDNLGTINLNESNYELAEDYIKQALEINLRLGNPRYISGNYTNLGILYKSTQRYDEALENYNKALDLGEQLGNIVIPIQINYNIGVLHNEMGEHETAIEYFRKSLELSRSNNFDTGYFYNYSGLGESYRDLGNYDESIRNFELSLELAESMNQIGFIKSTLKKLSLVHEKKGETPAAFSYLKRYSAITDSLANTEREEALARQEAMLNLRTERQNRELAEQALASQKNTLIISYILLFVIALTLVALFVFYQKKNRSNRELKEKTVELENVNKDKDKLLSILAHDLRNPLSSLQGVVYLIQEGALNNEDMDKVLAEIDHRLQHGITILTNYLQWAQNQKEGIEAGLRPVNVKEIVDETLNEIRHSAVKKSVTVEVHVDDELTMLADQNMMQVILRNLISNSIKYVNEGGAVVVMAQAENQKIVLSVSDTGVGIPEEKKKDIFNSFSYTRIGTSGETGTGLGLSICKDFVEKQGGSISFESEGGKGTAFFVEMGKAEIPIEKEVYS
jgi:two-component system, sensor histidine kinase and response regulator